MFDIGSAIGSCMIPVISGKYLKSLLIHTVCACQFLVIISMTFFISLYRVIDNDNDLGFEFEDDENNNQIQSSLKGQNGLLNDDSFFSTNKSTNKDSRLTNCIKQLKTLELMN